MGTVTLLRQPFYAVVPGGGSPDPEPAGYERTLDGAASAIEHARLLSAGNGAQDVLLVTGKTARVIMRFANGAEVTGKLLPPPDFSPASVREIRRGSPGGHIPELCTHAQHQHAARNGGRKPRRSRNMPKAVPY